MNTIKIELPLLKEPDIWFEIKDKFNLDDSIFYRHFEYGDYGKIEIDVDENLNIVGGTFIQCGKEE